MDISGLLFCGLISFFKGESVFWQFYAKKIKENAKIYVKIY